MPLIEDAIDIVCNAFTAREIEHAQTGVDQDFRGAVRMPQEMQSGVPLEFYSDKVNRAGITGFLLIGIHIGIPSTDEIIAMARKRANDISALMPVRRPAGRISSCTISTRTARTMYCSAPSSRCLIRKGTERSRRLNPWT